MADDIFDQITKSKSGDIFDQLSARAPAPPQPETPPPDAQAQAQQSMLNNTALGSAPKGAGDAYTSLQAQGRIPPANLQFQKLIPAVAGGIGGSMVEGGAGLVPMAMRALGVGAGAAGGSAVQQAAEGQTPNPATALKTGAAYGGGELAGSALMKYAATPLVKWLTASKSTGAQLLQQASAKAGSAPVELSPETNKIVDQIMQQGKLGGTAPKVIRDLIERVGPNPNLPAGANPGPLTYDEARILQSNASSLSANEKMGLQGQMKSLVPQFAKSFGQDVQAAADQAGVGAQHAQGMKEYATAAARNRTLTNAGKLAGAGTTAYAAYRELQSLRSH